MKRSRQWFKRCKRHGSLAVSFCVNYYVFRCNLTVLKGVEWNMYFSTFYSFTKFVITVWLVSVHVYLYWLYFDTLWMYYYVLHLCNLTRTQLTSVCSREMKYIHIQSLAAKWTGPEWHINTVTIHQTMDAKIRRRVFWRHATTPSKSRKSARGSLIQWELGEKAVPENRKTGTAVCDLSPVSYTHLTLPTILRV